MHHFCTDKTPYVGPLTQNLAYLANERGTHGIYGVCLIRGTDGDMECV